MSLEDDTYCYKIVKQDMTWHAANAACEKEEGKLASVHNPGENTFIALKFKKAGIVQGWLGMHDSNEEGVFKWIDGSIDDFFRWANNGKTILNFSKFNSFIFLSVNLGICHQNV